VTAEGKVSTFAGGKEGLADGKGNAARFRYPNGIAMDRAGNLYVTDYGSNRIRKVTADGKVSTFAGSDHHFADGKGHIAQFNAPSGVVIDRAGNLYVTDSKNHRVRKVTPKGEVSTFAGSEEGFAEGKGSRARFNAPSGIVMDAAGNFYVADTENHRIRRISATGVVGTFAGSGKKGFADGKGNKALFARPSGIVMDGAGNLYVADSGNHSIRMVTPAGKVTTLAGGKQGFVDSRGSRARFNAPSGIVMDGAGNLYVADTGNNRVRKVTAKGAVSTLAGGGKRTESDGKGDKARFERPYGIVMDRAGNLYVTDNNRVRKVSMNGEVTTLAGSVPDILCAHGGGCIETGSFEDGPGHAARFWQPSGIALDAAGNLYVADTGNHRVRKIVVE
jgi:sugar lactone lactonase YvrE